MTLGRAAFLFAASILAGAVNSVAGGGTLLSFPAAIAVGLPPIVANATNAVAMVPGSLAAAWTYRRSLAGLGRLTTTLAVPGIAGALVGALILRHTPQRLFDGIVPWLVLGATLIILTQGLVTRARKHAASGTEAALPSAPPTKTPLPAPLALPALPTSLLVTIGLQFVVSVYGGYFGAAMGIVMLAFLGHITLPGESAPLGMHQMNAVKNVLAVSINAAASIDFIIHGLVRPAPAVLMAAGAITGGIAGGRLGRRARPKQVRRLIVAIGFAMTGLLAWRRYG